MTRDEALAKLEEIRAAAHDQFGAVERRLGFHPATGDPITERPLQDRLAQLDAHLETVAMVVEHLFDEHARVTG